MIAVSHPTGNQFVRALLAALHAAGTLEVFFTTVATASGRRHYELPRGKIRTRPFREIIRLAAQRLGADFLTVHGTGWASADSVYRDLDAAVARWIAGCRSGSRVYCYEDGALETFRAAKQAGLGTFYELPIAYWETSRRLLLEEAERLPEWEPTLFATRDPDEKLRRKTEELALADLVVCPSRFVRESLPDAARQKCVVAEFGSPPVRTRPRNAGPRLRVLFAGTLSQRKGLADLFDAMKTLNRSDVELVVMGSPAAPMNFYRRQYDGFVYEPTRPHAGVLDLMSTCDVLALPSIVEGRALVQQEAMSCGLPLLVTENAGGGDLIREGETGFLVPIRSPAAIAEKIAWFADHRNLLPMMQEAARQKAAEYTWAAYAGKILDAVNI
jgi:glycosyltransferase involved in cell wall biosynthesis